MAVRTKEVLKSYFETGDKPTQEEFADLIDTFVTEPDLEDKLKGLEDTFEDKLKGLEDTFVTEPDLEDKLKDISPFEKGSAENSAVLKGGNNKAEGTHSFASGLETEALGIHSHAEGYKTNASGQQSHAEGYNTIASGQASHAEGYNNKARGAYSHVEGNNSSAKGFSSHAEGRDTYVTGEMAHAEGYNTKAKKNASHTEGVGTVAENNAGEHAEGKYNKSNEGTLHSVGIGISDNDRKNAHEIMGDGKHYIYGIGGYDGTNPTNSEDLATAIKNLIEITYTDLVNLRDNAKLTSGRFYRITDYETTTSLVTSRAAGHPFDLVVLALSSSELSERAWAVHSERDVDGYFANAKLSAWKIWYCLDNDIERFAWAVDTSEETIIGTINTPGVSASGTYTYDIPISKVRYYGKTYNLEIGVRTMINSGPPCYVTKTDEFTLVVEETGPGYIAANGGISIYGIVSHVAKGVIYRMIDEWGNDVPYDFKNIILLPSKTFVATLYGASHTYTQNGKKIVVNGVDYFGYTRTKTTTGPPAPPTDLYVDVSVLNENMGLYEYTDTEMEAYSSATIQSVDNKEDGTEQYTFSGGLDDATMRADGKKPKDNIIGKLYANNQVQLNHIILGAETENNIFKENCYSIKLEYLGVNNHFDAGCSDIHIGPNSKNNVFGPGCQTIELRGSNFDNKIGGSCSDIKCENGVNYNVFNYGCKNIILGISCTNNVFNVYCNGVIFDPGCTNNRLGAYVSSVEFASNCLNNELGNRVSTISFTSDCLGNKIESFSTNIIMGATCQYNVVGKVCSNINLPDYARHNRCADRITQLVVIPKSAISESNLIQGYRFSSFLNTDTFLAEPGRSYETVVALNSSGEIVEFCMADIASKVDEITITVDE